MTSYTLSTWLQENHFDIFLVPLCEIVGVQPTCTVDELSLLLSKDDVIHFFKDLAQRHPDIPLKTKFHFKRELFQLLNLSTSTGEGETKTISKDHSNYITLEPVAGSSHDHDINVVSIAKLRSRISSMRTMTSQDIPSFFKDLDHFEQDLFESKLNQMLNQIDDIVRSYSKYQEYKQRLTHIESDASDNLEQLNKIEENLDIETVNNNKQTIGEIGEKKVKVHNEIINKMMSHMNEADYVCSHYDALSQEFFQYCKSTKTLFFHVEKSFHEFTNKLQRICEVNCDPSQINDCDKDQYKFHHSRTRKQKPLNGASEMHKTARKQVRKQQKNSNQKQHKRSMRTKPVKCDSSPIFGVYNPKYVALATLSESQRQRGNNGYFIQRMTFWDAQHKPRIIVSERGFSEGIHKWKIKVGVVSRRGKPCRYIAKNGGLSIDFGIVALNMKKFFSPKTNEPKICYFEPAFNLYDKNHFGNLGFDVVYYCSNLVPDNKIVLGSRGHSNKEKRLPMDQYVPLNQSIRPGNTITMELNCDSNQLKFFCNDKYLIGYNVKQPGFCHNGTINIMAGKTYFPVIVQQGCSCNGHNRGLLVDLIQ